MMSDQYCELNKLYILVTYPRAVEISRVFVGEGYASNERESRWQISDLFKISFVFRDCFCLSMPFCQVPFS